jgi:hypothetical protein
MKRHAAAAVFKDFREALVLAIGCSGMIAFLYRADIGLIDIDSGHLSLGLPWAENGSAPVMSGVLRNTNWPFPGR